MFDLPEYFLQFDKKRDLHANAHFIYRYYILAFSDREKND